MCGIVAVIGDLENKEEKLRFALSKIQHRGDYRFEMAVFEYAALGANRLAIVDEPHGAQPLTDETESIQVVQNGEIFNFKELTKELKGKGHVFKTETDTEVLAHLWEEYREQLIEKLDSEMLAFILFDKTDGTVFAARDRLGVKPLYYAQSNNGYLFASEVKAFVDLEGVDEVNEFPAGHYFLNGTFTKYYDIPSGEQVVDRSEKKMVSAITEIFEVAVKKRIQTDLPIGVFLSGGVDSSLTMEMATRHHPNVTALILGFEDSADAKYARSLCRDKGWKYHMEVPDIDYEMELKDIVYHLESFDPNVVRHSFANNAISKLARKLGFKVVLVGEGSDELFAGYNEFLDLNPAKINLGCNMLLKSMSRGNLMRVDKLAMRHTIETRIPFFDNKLVEFAMSIGGEHKIGEHNGERYVKLILRKAAAQFLPEDTAFRHKEAFANGAGMQIGFNYKKADGILGEIAERVISGGELADVKRKYPEYQLETKEEALIFKHYASFGYTKYVEGRERLMVKDTLLTL